MARNNNYKWDGDSRDERPSEFAHSGYSTTTTAALHSTWAYNHRVRRKRRTRLARLLLPVLVAAGASSLLMYFVVSHLRG